jgi:predicted NBD/HSP70 family sugar kinase
VADGEVVRGHGGLAGEIAHLITRGPRGRAIAFTDVFAELGLRQPSSSAIDVPMLLAAVTGAGRTHGGCGRRSRRLLCDVVSALVALADPESVVIGGPWGSCEPVRNAVAAGTAQLPPPGAHRRLRKWFPKRPLAGGGGTRSIDWCLLSWQCSARCRASAVAFPCPARCRSGVPLVVAEARPSRTGCSSARR